MLDGNIRFRLSRHPEKKRRGWPPHEAVTDKSTLGWIVTNVKTQAVKVTLGKRSGHFWLLVVIIALIRSDVDSKDLVQFIPT